MSRKKKRTLMTSVSRTGALLLSVGFLFSGCAGTGETPTAPGQASEKELRTVSEADAREAYYEALILQLQQELLEAKAALFTKQNDSEILPDEARDVSAQQNDAQNFTYQMENGKVTVTGYTGSARELVIPELLGGAPVTAIADHAFENRNALVSVVLPEGVGTVGWFAFSGCVALREVTLPPSVQSVGYGAFLNCAPELTVLCFAGSYAERFAQSYGYRTREP